MILYFALAHVGCETATDDPAVGEVPVELVPLDAPRLLRRISLDLRGKLPPIDELDRVEADPTQVPVLAVTYLADPNFEDRLVSLLAERWHTVLDVYEVNFADYRLEPEYADGFAHAVGEEPLRLIAHVVANDLPYADIVTADYTMANHILGSVWPLERASDDRGWTQAWYTDKRPPAGVLSTNGFYWRYVTNISNKNRGRVAAISRLLLCTDMLGRPVNFERSQSLDPEEAIRTEPGCVTCHSTVDPMAASMFGFWWTIQYNPYEMQTYHPERERLGPELLLTQPGYYGTPMAGLVDLGWYLSEDPRFNRCAAESYAEQLWRRPSDVSDYETIETIRADFEAQGTHPQALILDVLATPQYGAGGFTAEASDDTRAREVVERLLSPNQQRLVFEELAGLDFSEFDYVGLENDVLGYRVLAGGVDGYSVTSPQAIPGLTWELVNKRIAQASAQLIVERDLAHADATILSVGLEARPGEVAFDDQLAALHWRFFAVRTDDAWVAEMGALWTSVLAIEGPTSAWEAVLEACFRDPLFVAY